MHAATEHFSYLTSICGRRSKIASLYYGDFSIKTDFERKTNFEQKTEHSCQLAQRLVLKHFWRFARIVERSTLWADLEIGTDLTGIEPSRVPELPTFFSRRGGPNRVRNENTLV
jgi:hypothetical protein